MDSKGACFLVWDGVPVDMEGDKKAVIHALPNTKNPIQRRMARELDFGLTLPTRKGRLSFHAVLLFNALSTRHVHYTSISIKSGYGKRGAHDELVQGVTWVSSTHYSSYLEDY